MGTEPWLDAIDQSTQCNSVVPICGEILDVLVWNLSIDPGKHGIFRREALSRAADLEFLNQGPDETQDQLQVTIIDVLWTYRMDMTQMMAAFLAVTPGI